MRSEIPASEFQEEKQFAVVDRFLLPDHGVAAVGVLRPRLTEDGWHFVYRIEFMSIPLRESRIGA